MDRATRWQLATRLTAYAETPLDLLNAFFFDLPLEQRNAILARNDEASEMRSEITLRASVVRTIRPDTVFIPYHWAGRQSANLLTHRTLDPRSKIPEFKVSACRIRRAEGENA